jgi:acyl-CoA thioester hydrolase
LSHLGASGSVPRPVVPLEIRVLYGDTDQMGVVYYANYLRYFEAGRGEFLRVRGQSYRDFEAQGLKIPVVEAWTQYRAPARYDDLLTVETSLSEVRRASLRFTYEVRRKGEGLPVTFGSTLHACLDAGGRPVRLPPMLLAMKESAAENSARPAR